jgi:hypothetical protein
MKTMQPNRQQGSSLILALVLVAAAAAGAATCYTFTASQTTMAKKTLDLLKARSIAESGLTIAYAKLRADMSLVGNPNAFPWTSFDGGQCMATLTTVASNRMTLVSIGKFNNVQAQVRVDLRYYPSVQVAAGGGGSSGGTIYGPYVFTHALYVGGTCDWKGCGTFSGGNVYVNGLLDLGGNGTWTKGTGTLNVYSSTKVATSGSADLTCTSVTAPIIYEKKSGGIVGTKVVAAVAAPTLPAIELSTFYQVALNNGQVKSGSFSVPSGYTPAGGVLWCEGSLDFKGTATGCFIATAGVTMEAGADVRPGNANWPTIYNKSGDISFTGQAETRGFVYAGGDVKFTGGGALQGGPVIIKGNLQKGGNSDMTDMIASSGFVIIPPVVNPQQYSNTVARLVVTGWQ